MPVSHTWRSFPCHPPCQLRAQRLGDGENWYEPGSNVREAIALKSMGCQSSPVDPDCRRPAPTPKHRLRTWGSEVRILPGAPKQPATGRFFCARRIAGPPRTAGVRARAKRCFASGSRSPFRARQNNRPLAGFFVPGGLPARRGRRAFAPARSGASRAAVAHPSGRARTTGHWPVFLCPADFPARRERRAFAHARSDASRAVGAQAAARNRSTGVGMVDLPPHAPARVAWGRAAAHIRQGARTGAGPAQNGRVPANAAIEGFHVDRRDARLRIVRVAPAVGMGRPLRATGRHRGRPTARKAAHRDRCLHALPGLRLPDSRPRGRAVRAHRPPGRPVGRGGCGCSAHRGDRRHGRTSTRVRPGATCVPQERAFTPRPELGRRAGLRCAHLPAMDRWQDRGIIDRPELPECLMP